MKIYILGRGHRIAQIREALGMSKLLATVITDDAAAMRFDPPDLTVAPGDFVIVAEYEEEPLRAILENLRRQKVPATVMIFTSIPTRNLVREYPEFIFREEGLIYRNELRELQRRAAGIQKVEAIRRAVKGSPLLTLIWGNPDPDAIASAYALHELVQQDAGPAVIAYTGEFTRPENVAMVNLLKITTRKYAPELVTPSTVVATVDAQPTFFQLDGRVRFDVIVDHHPLADLGTYRFADVRPTYGSTSTILTEYFQTTGTRMSKKVATALYYGLKIDTGNLTRNVSDADVAAFRYLRVRSDENLVRTIELSQLPVETLDHFGVAIANKKISRDVVFAYLGTIPNPDMCVHVADFFIKLAGISWAAIACRSKERVVVVFRSDGLRKHAGRMAEALFLEYGSAGGHRTMARAELDLARLQPELREPGDVAIEEWLIRRLAVRLKPLARFVRT
jgi:nanoRNase/pAp phosphatase (c-di-AMP/oligoRNAs hydrolase)